MTDEKEKSGDFDEHDWSDLEGEEASRLLRGLEAVVPGILRRAIVSALSDEGIKGVVSEKNIPKEAVGFVLSQADSTRREILRIVSREIRTFLENMDFGGEIAKILTTLSFEIRTEVRFIPNNDAVRPNVKNRVKVKRTREDGTTETVNEFEDEIDGTAPPAPSAAPAKGEPSKAPKGETPRRRWTRRRTGEES